MPTLRTFTALLAGFALAAVLFSGLDRAVSDEHEQREGPDPAERSHAQLIQRVKRAATNEGAKHEFQLVIAATEAGMYVESYGNLDGEDAAILGKKLMALGEMVAAPAEIGEVMEALEELEEELEELNEEHERGHDRERGHDDDGDDEHEDDDDEGDEHDEGDDDERHDGDDD